MRSEDVCMWISVCGDMSVTKKQTNVNSSVG